ncbi:MAG: CHASE2 domain-containing protein [Candidatus Thiodiazotropha sp.]
MEPVGLDGVPRTVGIKSTDWEFDLAVMGTEPLTIVRRGAPGSAESLRTALILLVFTGFMAASGWLWRWDLLLYDLQMGWMTRAAADDIVIVAVDEKSLEAIGRWPWPRYWHAELIDRLSRAGARAIVFDILLAEPDPNNPEADRRLI